MLRATHNIASLLFPLLIQKAKQRRPLASRRSMLDGSSCILFEGIDLPTILHYQSWQLSRKVLKAQLLSNMGDIKSVSDHRSQYINNVLRVLDTVSWGSFVH